MKNSFITTIWSESRYHFQISLSVLESDKEIGCPIMCENIEYQITNQKLGKNIRLGNQLYNNKTFFFAKKNSNIVKIEEQYTLMGPSAIISATGGSLGLFLGLSCYGIVWKLFKGVEATYNLLRSKADRTDITDSC